MPPGPPTHRCPSCGKPFWKVGECTGRVDPVNKQKHLHLPALSTPVPGRKAS